MRLGTWNCQTSLGSKWDAVEALNADVLAIQECGPNTRDQVTGHDGWTCEWQMGTYRNGLAVLAHAPYRIEIREEPSEPFFVSTVVSGPDRFRFVSFWARTPTFVGDEYPRQAARLIDQLQHDGIPIVIAGDFNASSRNEDHLGNVEILRSRGLVSAYHSFHGIAHTDAWNDATSYHHRREANPHHMDYVFVPAHWSIKFVEVGTYQDFPGKGLSDHAPVVVTVAPE